MKSKILCFLKRLAKFVEFGIIKHKITARAQVVGNKEEVMVKKSFLLVVLLAFVFLASGCTLAKATTYAAGGFVQGAKEGAKEDCNSIHNVDTWVKDNLW